MALQTNPSKTHEFHNAPCDAKHDREASVFSFWVSEEQHGERLDKFLALFLPEEATLTISRERIQALVESGAVMVQGKPCLKVSHRLKEGDALQITLPEAVPIALAAENIPLSVVFEDAEMLVVNKPAGMLTHPTGKEQTGTLVNALLHHCGASLSGINGVIRPGIVHRLDRDTAGLLMVAKTDRAHQHLSAQLKDKSARRSYWAIAQGKFPEDSGSVDLPIGRNPKQRDKMMVTNDGRPAVTHWRIEARAHDKAALLELNLETGRTHQIRVHMAHLGHPLLGDPLYGNHWGQNLKLKAHRGQYLQAFRLAFRHPINNESMRFEIPRADFLDVAWLTLQNS